MKIQRDGVCFGVLPYRLFLNTDIFLKWDGRTPCKVVPFNEQLSISHPVFNAPLIVSPPRCEALAAELGMIELLSTASTAWPPSVQPRGRGGLTGTASPQR